MQSDLESLRRVKPLPIVHLSKERHKRFQESACGLFVEHFQATLVREAVTCEACVLTGRRPEQGGR